MALSWIEALNQAHDKQAEAKAAHGTPIRPVGWKTWKTVDGAMIDDGAEFIVGYIVPNGEATSRLAADQWTSVKSPQLDRAPIAERNGGLTALDDWLNDRSPF